ncbi:MAG TPA: type II secretion system F family protein [Terrimicrobiaceae bacterium]
MATFTYKALDAVDKMQSGDVKAASRTEAYQILVSRLLRPVHIAAGEPAGMRGAARKSSSAPRLAHSHRLAPARLLQFTEELADLLEAGLQLDPALGAMESRQEKSAIKELAGGLRHHIREGKSFSSALGMFPAAFPLLYVNMVAAGEAAGALPKILRKQTEYLNVVIELRRKVASALIYPSIVFCAGIVLMIVFMTFLLPQLTILLNKTGQSLPLVTRALIAVSDFMGRWWWAVCLAAVLAAISHRLWARTPRGRAVWDRIVLRLPVLGGLIRQRFLAQFLHTLSSMVSNGVTLLQALSLAVNATGNSAIRAVLLDIAAQVAEGASLTRCMRKAIFFPPTLVDIIAVGEQTGDIALALQRGATKYDKEFTDRMQQITTLIQPLTILVVALFVGVVAYSMITGILTTVSGLRTR